MTNAVALAGTGPDLVRPTSSAGRSGQGRNGSARDGFAALVDGPRGRPAQASEGPDPTQEDGPAAPDEDRLAEGEASEECIDPWPSELQAWPLPASPNNPRELAPGFIGRGFEAERTESEEPLLSLSEQVPGGSGDGTAAEPAAAPVADMTEVNRPGAWPLPMAAIPDATGGIADLPAPKAGPWTSRSERILDAMLRGPVEIAGPPADEPVLARPFGEETKGPGAGSAPAVGLSSKDVPAMPGSGSTAGLGSWAAPGAFAATAYEPLRTARTPDPSPERKLPSEVALVASADAAMQVPSASPAIHRAETSRAPGVKSVVKGAASETVVAKTSDAGSEGEVPANGPVLPSSLVAPSGSKAIGSGPVPGPGVRVRDKARPAGTEDRVSFAPLLSGGPTGTGTPGPAPAHPTASEAQRVARQVATHPVLRTGGSAEVNLAPQELGHLRLSVEMADGGLRVVIEAARPETCDLMRRHVETLRQELRQEGLGAVSVSISGGESRQGDGRAPSGRQDHVAPAFGAETATGDLGSLGPSDLPLPRQARTSGHLDLRF